MSQLHLCTVCESHVLTCVEGFAELPRISSDCKAWPVGGELYLCQSCGAIQKLANDTWLKDINEIYDSYDLWPLSGNNEQPIFTGEGVAEPRSKLLIDFIKENTIVNSAGKLIDIGCGTGAALVNFSVQFPGWHLYAADLSDRALLKLKTISNFQNLYIGEVSAISNKFDMVLMIHSLEHFTELRHTIKKIINLLNPGGKIFIQVPNVLKNPFDLLIVDHSIHFLPDVLLRLLAGLCVEIEIVSTSFLPKEISMMVNKSLDSKTMFKAFKRTDISYVQRYLESSIQWLKCVIEDAKEHRASVRKAGYKFGIFGTSISGIWLFNALGGDVDYFVDEDKARHGSTHSGAIVIGPDLVGIGDAVYVPFSMEISKDIACRLGRDGRSFISTPLQD